MFSDIRMLGLADDSSDGSSGAASSSEESCMPLRERGAARYAARAAKTCNPCTAVRDPPSPPRMRPARAQEQVNFSR